MSKESISSDLRKLMSAPFLMTSQLLTIHAGLSSIIDKQFDRNSELNIAGILLLVGGLIYPLPDWAKSTRRMVITQLDKFKKN